MSTYREIVYMVLDELKIQSDDSEVQEEHAIFLANKYRCFLLKQHYSNIKKEIPTSNYQVLCLDLIEVPAISGIPCEGGSYLRTKEKIPNQITIGNPIVSPIDYYQGNIALIDRERMRYVGHNKWLQNIIYCSQGPDNYLYFTSSNPQFKYLEKVKYTGIFENAEQAAKLSCDTEESKCDILNMEFPLEDSLIPQLIELIVKELTPVEYKPTDVENNASDDLANINKK